MAAYFGFLQKVKPQELKLYLVLQLYLHFLHC